MRSVCQKYLASQPFMPWPLHSRTHLLWKNSYGEVWVKRDDELSFIASGPKRRKHASFFAMALEKKVPGLHIQGSIFSSNILAMAASCRELGIPFFLDTPKAKSPLKGNALLNSLIQRQEAPDPSFMVVPEGANHPWSLAGALTLGLDFEGHFDQVICDGGTGYGAAALGYTLDNGKLITLKMAPCDLSQVSAQIAKQLRLPLALSSQEVQICSGLAPIGKKEWKYLKETWQNHGILLDPIYTARSFYWTQEQFNQGHLPGKTLLIHTGGGISLLGFEAEFLK